MNIKNESDNNFCKQLDGEHLRKVELHAEIIMKVKELREQGYTGQYLVDKLNAEQIPTFNGGEWKLFK